MPVRRLMREDSSRSEPTELELMMVTIFKLDVGALAAGEVT